MSVEKRTVKQWVHHLEGPDQELTLTEFMALNLLHIRENMLQGRLASEHLEGMIGSLDEFLARTNPIYQGLAQGRAKPVPALPDQANHR